MTNAFLQLAHDKARLKDPRVLLFRHWQKLDENSARLQEEAKRLLAAHKNRLVTLKDRLQSLAPLRTLRIKKDALFASKTALNSLNPKVALKALQRDVREIRGVLQDDIKGVLHKARHNFVCMVTKLHALSPLRVFARGYSVVQSEDKNAVLSKVAHFAINQIVTIRIEDGRVTAVVKSIWSDSDGN